MFDALFVSSNSLLAQAASDTSWAALIMEIETQKIIILAIFGTGMIIAAGFALSSIIRAAQGSPAGDEELKEQIAALEARVSHLEGIVKQVSDEQLVG